MALFLWFESFLCFANFWFVKFIVFPFLGPPALGGLFARVPLEFFYFEDGLEANTDFKFFNDWKSGFLLPIELITTAVADGVPTFFLEPPLPFEYYEL